MYTGKPTKCDKCNFVKYTRTIGHYSLHGFEGEPIIEGLERVGNILVGTNVIVEEREICACSEMIQDVK